MSMVNDFFLNLSFKKVTNIRDLFFIENKTHALTSTVLKKALHLLTLG